MSNPQPSAQWWVVEYMDWDEYIAYMHFFREKSQAIARFEELCDICREYTECPEAGDELSPEDIKCWLHYTYKKGESFWYHNGDDEYYHYEVVRIQANTSINLHY